MDEPLFDASSDPQRKPECETASPQVDARVSRPFLGIRFDCCKTYGRIYRNQNGTAYEGKCPNCMAKVTVPIGKSGTSSRFFTAN